MYENAFTNIEKALRAEAGIANELDYVEQISSAKLEDHMKARYHSVGEGKEVLGGVTRTRRTYRGFQQELYQG